MPKEEEKILKYIHREKSLTAPFIFIFDIECLLKNCNLVKTILKNLIQRKKTSMKLQVGLCLQSVRLIMKKAELIITEEQIVLKRGVKI